MKYLLMFISLTIVLVSCKSNNETIAEPEYFGEGFGENFEISASYGSGGCSISSQ